MRVSTIAMSMLLLFVLSACSIGAASGRGAAGDACAPHVARAGAALAVTGDSASAVAAAHAEHASAMHQYHHCLGTGDPARQP
jgi:hypothetical protein